MSDGTSEAFLKRQLSMYHHPDATRRDVISVLKRYHSLSHRMETFVFNDGLQKELFNLNGTIPVPFKGNYYNIPICIWLMDTHPYHAPMCYVKPTPEMEIRVSPHVDNNGKVYLPYLHNWQPKTSDLLGVIQVMTCCFAESPPVFTRRRPAVNPVGNSPSTQTATTTPYPTQSYMPMPGAASGTSGPPYPMNNSGRAPLPYPLAPQSGGHFPSMQGMATPGYPAYPPYPMGTPQVQPVQESGIEASGTETGTITGEHIRASLLSAVEDKLRRRLREQCQQAMAESETLRRTGAELAHGKQRLDIILSRLEKEQMELEKITVILREKEQELSKAIARLEEQKTIDVDDAVTTTAPLYKQLLNAFAEEAATEDAIYYLGEALRREVIDLETFLKHVRTLSRKQFTLRALMHKCRQKAGLVG
ncbi:tumor susceptibility gene 101 protein [Hetaerina americana]|uniref:tumor susceptibility gene 101 protein n=1 Tax=Hetaerina americana TaxID=62018 RepID=UPI003A7F5AAA